MTYEAAAPQKPPVSIFTYSPVTGARTFSADEESQRLGTRRGNGSIDICPRKERTLKGREGKESSAQPSSMVNKCDAVPEGRALSGKLQLQQARKGLHRACAVNGKPLAAPTLCPHGRVPDWLCICTRVQIAYEVHSPTKQHTTHRDL